MVASVTATSLPRDTHTRGRASFDRFSHTLSAEPAWVVDALWRAGRAYWLERASLIVALDYGRWLTFRRLASRTIRRLHTREEICNGNVETIGGVLSRDSILAWHARTYAGRRTEIAELAANPAGPPVLRLRHPRQANAWLARLAGSTPVDSDHIGER